MADSISITELNEGTYKFVKTGQKSGNHFAEIRQAGCKKSRKRYLAGGKKLRS